MTWTKLGDEFFPLIRGLSDAAALLHIKALGWSNWLLLDLVVTRDDVATFGNIKSKPLNEAINELIDSGWLQMIDDDTYWIGCRFADWQRDKIQVERRREQLALAQRRKRRHDPGDHSICIKGRCKSLSTVDSSDDYADDPGRLRLRDGTGKAGLEETEGFSSSEEPEPWPSVTPPGSACLR